LRRIGSYETWFERANERLSTFGAEVLYLLSERAKALIKLTHKGFGCPSIPDLFHVGRDLAKGYSLILFGRLRQAKRELEQVKQRLEQSHTNPQADPSQIAENQAQVAACAASVHHWQEVGSTWRQHLSNLSRIVHPGGFRTRNTRPRRRLKSSCKANLRPSKRFLRPTGCR